MRDWWGDPSRLRQILLNLFGNAVKFTERGRVTLAITARSGNGRLHFSVSDTGIGLSETAQNKLFQSFTQADSSTTRRFGGTGLGLAICRQLVDLMGGSIGVESVLGQGSTFWFVLPLAAPETAEAAANRHPAASVPAAVPDPPAPAPAASDVCILLAEDNQINQLVAVQQLRKIGYRNVEVAKNGLEALQAWQARRHRVILMDCQMPEMDGYTASQKIRDLEKSDGLPAPWIIALTASAMEDDRANCLAAGMNSFVSKPVSTAGLKAAIEQALTESGALNHQPA